MQHCLIPPSILQDSLPAFPGLLKLVVSRGSENIDDHFLAQLGNHCKQLMYLQLLADHHQLYATLIYYPYRELNLEKCRWVTDTGIRQLCVSHEDSGTKLNIHRLKMSIFIFE